MKLSPSFHISEFLCPCNDCIYSDPGIDKDILVSPLFIDKLQQMRNEVGKPFRINSGARCVRHNEAVGGVATSGHLVTVLKPCEAADISTKGWTGATKYKFLRSAFKYNMWGIGVDNTYVHVDSKKSRKAVWSY